MKRKCKPIDGGPASDPVRSSIQPSLVPSRFRRLPEGERALTLPQFFARLRADDGFAEKMRAHYESMLAVPETPQTAAMRKKAADALRTLKDYQGVWLGGQCLAKVLAILDAVGTRCDPESLAAISALADEASDHLLDALEPGRTELMVKVTRIREDIAALLGPA